MSSFVRDSAGEADPDIAGVDRHYYEKQVPPSSPFNDTSFQFAAAVAKDKARHQLIKAVIKAQQEARATFLGAQDYEAFIGNGTRSLSESANGELGTYEDAARSIDGIKGAPNDAIKL